MQTIAIITPSDETAPFRAVSGNQQASGRTMGEALDSLAAQLSPEGATLVLIQKQQPDNFFTGEQHERMRELMARQKTLMPDEIAELEALVDAELDATIARTDALVQQLAP